jgi:predicted enzyme involved in methoxymalonyl-ACP biosynthesis
MADSAQEAVDKLRHHWVLDPWYSGMTAEDHMRTQLYKDKAARKAARRESAARNLKLSEFLRELGLRVEVRAPAEGAEFARVAQLTMRTNQMNSTMQRFASEQDLESWLGPGYQRAGANNRWIRAGWCADRIGAYGMVACALCRLSPLSTVCVIYV